MIPSLEKLQKEGEAGQKRITQYTRYLTVALAALQSSGYVFLFHNGSVIGGSNILPDLTVALVPADRPDADGGHDAADVDGRAHHAARRRQRHVAADLRLDPDVGAGRRCSAWVNSSTFQRLSLPIVILGVILAVVFINEGQRRIPIQYAKRMVGRRMTSGGATYMPLRVNMAGVIPVIFAVAVLFFPPTIGQLIPSPELVGATSSRRTTGRRPSSSSR